MIRIEETSRADRDSRSMSTVLMRASAQEVMGGEKGIVCVLLSAVRSIIADRDISESCAPRADRGESEQ